MTNDEKTGKLPGARLSRFAERFFEQPGLEKIALPIIADLQHEYSRRSDKSITRFLILLRGYLSFWKAIGIYSLFSSRGDIRPFQSIGFVLFLGAIVGTIVSIFSWMGNQTKGLVNIFPNWFTALLFLSLLFLAIWFCTRHLPDPRFRYIWKIARRIAAVNGIILGTACTLLCFRMFQGSVPFVFVIFFYLITLALTLVFGLIASLLVRCTIAFHPRRNAD